jgi:hypothetical protein
MECRDVIQRKATDAVWVGVCGFVTMLKVAVTPG